MSETVLVGVVGARHWTYTAAVMAEHLFRVRECGSTLPSALAMGVYRNALRFFALILSADEDAASLTAYRIATEALADCVQPAPASFEQVTKHLREYETLLRYLGTEQKLGAEELSVAESLCAFLAWIATRGQEEDYLEAMGFGSEHAGAVA